MDENRLFALDTDFDVIDDGVDDRVELVFLDVKVHTRNDRGVVELKHLLRRQRRNRDLGVRRHVWPTARSGKIC